MLQPSTSLARNLYVLRWFAVAGQVLAIVVAVGLLDLPLPMPPLWCAIGALTMFNIIAALRLRRGTDLTPAEAFGHIVFDTVLLAWSVAWTGGIANPFASLFLLPVALTALALPAAWSIASATVCVLGYGSAVLFAQPLPHAAQDVLDLHLTGMAINFLLSVVLVAYFLAKLAAARDRRNQELAQLRERFVRNEGIVVLATHAASVAHELNTPLATMGLLLDDMDPRGLTRRSAADLRTVRRLVDTCADRVRSLARCDEGAGVIELDRLLDQWRLMRPTITLHRRGDARGNLVLDRALGHLMLVLLNNAADAGEVNDEPHIELELRLENTTLRGVIRDHGPGFGAHEPILPVLFRSTKPDGLGVGLTLSHAAMERLGGTLTIEDAPGGGARVCFSIPYATTVSIHDQALWPKAEPT